MIKSDIIEVQNLEWMSSRPRICFLSPAHWSAAMGGAEYQMKLLIDHLVNENRFDISYLARITATDTSSDSYSIYNVRNRITSRSTYCLDALRIWQVLKSIRPHLVYQRVGCAYTGLAAYYGTRYEIPTIWHIASEMDLTSKTPAGRSSVPGVNKLDRRILDYGIRNSTYIIAQTQSQAAMLDRKFGRTASRVIANFHPAPDEIPHKARAPIIVIWVGNLKSVKRPELFMRLVRDFRGHDSLEFKMIGAQTASRPYDAEINETYIANPNFRYLGRCEQADVNSLLAKSHIFVSTSEQEGFPNTFIQAWMRKVPVVSLDVDPDGVIASNNIGIVCSSYDSLRTAVATLVDESARRVTQGENASRYATSTHSMANAAQIGSLMTDALSSASNARLNYTSDGTAVNP